MECFTCGCEVMAGDVGGMCYSCGVESGIAFEKKNKEPTSSNKKTQTQKDFQKYKLPGKIKGMSIMFYDKITNGCILKDSNRRGRMWMCCYEAYKHHHIAVDPIILSKMFRLTKKNINKALRGFWEKVLSNGLLDQFPKIQLSVKDLIPYFRELFDLDPIIENDMNNIFECLNSYSTSITRYRPRDVAISIIYWYLKEDLSTHDMKDMGDFCKKCYIGKTTLMKIVVVIKQIVEIK